MTKVEEIPFELELKFPISMDFGENGGEVHFSRLRDVSNWARTEIDYWTTLLDAADPAYRKLLSVMREYQLNPPSQIACAIKNGVEKIANDPENKTAILNALHDELSNWLNTYRRRTCLHSTSVYASEFSRYSSYPFIAGQFDVVADLSAQQTNQLFEGEPEVVQSEYGRGISAAHQFLDEEELNGAIQNSRGTASAWDSETFKSVLARARYMYEQAPSDVVEWNLRFGKVRGLDELRLKRSSDAELDKKIDQIRAKMQEHAARVPFMLQWLDAAQLSSAFTVYTGILNVLSYMSASSDAEYQEELANYKVAVNELLDRLVALDPIVLEAELKTKISDADTKLREVSAKVITAEEMVDKAKEAATVVTESATSVAQGLSYLAFQKAADENRNKGMLALASGSGLIVLMFIVLLSFLTSPLPGYATGSVHAAWMFGILRLTLVAGLGVLAAMCFALMKSQFHLREHNLHRQRILDLVQVLREAAQTDQRKDLVVQTLVDAIAGFGSSGIINEVNMKDVPSLLPLLGRFSGSKDNG